MFKLTLAPTYWWPVVIRQPSQTDAGKFVESSLEVEFAYLTTSANEVLMEDVRAHQTPDTDVVPRIVTGFRAVEDEQGQPLAFTAEALHRLSDLPGAASAIVRAYFASRAGGVAPSDTVSR